MPRFPSHHHDADHPNLLCTGKYDPIKVGSIDGTDREPHDRAIERALHAEYVPNKLVKGEPRYTVFVARLNPRTTQDTLVTEFSKYGKIVSCRLIKDIVTGKSKRYAFIEYEDSTCMERAYWNMHKEVIDSAEILVEREAERRLPGWKPRRLGGGFGGFKESGQLRFGGRARPFKKPYIVPSQQDSYIDTSGNHWLCKDKNLGGYATVQQELCNIMCNVCWKEFKGWCKAFTANEVLLSILQAVLLVLLIAFLTFLILHLMACSEPDENAMDIEDIDEYETEIPIIVPTSGEQQSTINSTSIIPGTTLAPDIKCTWKPSQKTTAFTKYFEISDSLNNITISSKMPGENHTSVTKIVSKQPNEVINVDNPDGTRVHDYRRSIILALVKLRPPIDLTFGCILTAVSEYWTLTAASCIESIEEVDSLDSFVMMENFGQRKQGRIHVVSDVTIHPQYQGTNRTYDLAALKSSVKLVSRDKLLKLPTLIDYFLITIGERLTVLGFGKYRSIGNGRSARSLREVSVHALPSGACAGGGGGGGGAGALRHLWAGGAWQAAGCAPAAVCAAGLRARAAPCNYCAGAPLVYGRVLLALMADNDHCGVSCEPALYVNLAALRDWLHTVLDPE